MSVPDHMRPAQFPDEDIISFCERANLIERRDLASFEPLTGGVASDIWLVRSDDRAFCVKRALPRLRVAAEWKAPTERNLYEARWLRMSAAVMAESAPELLAEDPKAAMFAMAYLPPQTYPCWKERLLAGEVDVAFAGEVGRSLVRLHSAFAADRDNERLFDSAEIFEHIRIEPYLRATAAAHPRLTSALNGLAERTLATRLTVGHGDVSPKNILAGPRAPVFIDGECAWYGDPAFDLAFCLNHLLLKCLVVKDRIDSLMASFSTLARAYLDGVDWEAAEETESRAASLLPALFLARIDGKSPAEYLTREADKARVRRVASPLVISSPRRLAEVQSRWIEELKQEREHG